MSTGIIGTTGPRIRLAREICCLTQQELAATAEISQGTLSDIEVGRVLQPSEEIVKKISMATSFPMSFFERGALPDIPDGYYRRQTHSPSKIDKQIRAQIRLIVEIVERAEAELKLPKVRLNPLDEVISLEEIEDYAVTIRHDLGIGSSDRIPNLMLALERSGTIVARLAREMPGYDSYSAWPNMNLGGRPVIAITPGHPGDRDRFNLGHELGHLLFHTARPKVEKRRAEKEAHRFAGALLLPKEVAQEALSRPLTLRILMGVKATYGISIAAGAKRALDLGLIDQVSFVSVRKQISARQWRKEEPVDVPQELPTLMPEILARLAGEGTISQKANRLSLPPFIFRSLTTARAVP